MAISKEFVLAGNSIFTVEEADGTHHTYRVRYAEANGKWPEAYFVGYLAGPDNTRNYAKLGKLDAETGVVSTYGATHNLKSSRKLAALNRVLACVWSGDHAAYERHGWRTHHEGRCGRCGRLLTVPESIETGFGPECIHFVNAERILSRIREKDEFSEEERRQEELAFLSDPDFQRYVEEYAKGEI